MGQITEYVAVISAATALISVFLGPLVTLHVARKQLRATIVSQNRIRWVEELRNDVADFMAVLNEAYVTHNRSREKDIPQTLRPTRDDLVSVNMRLSRQRSILRLKLTPDDEDHTELYEIIQKTVGIVGFITKTDQVQFQKYSMSLITTARKLLKAEWKRASSLK
jgi:hypothetical protein